MELEEKEKIIKWVYRKALISLSGNDLTVQMVRSKFIMSDEEFNDLIAEMEEKMIVKVYGKTFIKPYNFKLAMQTAKDTRLIFNIGVFFTTIGVFQMLLHSKKNFDLSLFLIGVVLTAIGVGILVYVFFRRSINLK